MHEPLSKGQQRRQRRIAERRGAILDAAAVVFAQKGYEGTTTKEIADAADVAEGTLYNYFGSKRDILRAVAREAEAPMGVALREVGALESREAMIVLFERAYEITAARLPFLRTLLAAAWTDDTILNEFVALRLARIHDLIVDFIAQRVEAGAFRPIDPRLGARLVMGMFAGLILPVLRGVEPLPSPAQRRELSAHIVDLLLDGVRVRSG